MTRTALSCLLLGLATGAAGGVACSTDNADSLARKNAGGAGAGDGGSSASEVPPEEVLFRALEADFSKKCGPCHVDGKTGNAPPFLAPPDAYKSVKGHPGLVTKDTYDSLLLNKPAHLGPALASDTDLEGRIKTWLDAEALAINSIPKPTTAAAAIVQGANDIDLTQACIGGLAGVHLKFDASSLGSTLSINNIKLSVPGGTDVHILKPRFIEVLAKAVNGNTEIPDPANNFENTDQTVPQAADTLLGAGFAIFSAWDSYDFGADKIRIEIEKLEPGKVSVITPPAVCKDVAGFTAKILPNMNGTTGGFLNCASCHGNGLAGMSLNDNDKSLVCNQVLSKLSAPPNLANSLIIKKITVGPHSGTPAGGAPNAANWPAVFTANSAVFF